MSFDPGAVARAYGPGAEEYARKFARDLADNAFDRAVLEQLLTGTVLDAGCGPAQVCAFAEARGLHAIGVDITVEMLTAAMVAAPLVLGDLRQLPFADATFDTVVSWFSLLHLSRADMSGALGELRRVVRRGGALVVATHAGHGEVWHEEAGVLVTYYSAGELAELIATAGFVDVIVRTRPPETHEVQVTKLIVSGRRR